MNKLMKIFAILVVIVMALSVTMTVNAATNADVIAYISKSHTVNGRTGQLSSSEIQQLTQYLKNNPVSDAEADQMIAHLDAAKQTLANTGATKLSDISQDAKSKIMGSIQAAGSVAGLKVEFNTAKETYTVKDSKGNVIVSAKSYSNLNSASSTSSSSSATTGAADTAKTTKTTSSGKLVYTGSNYSVAIISGVAIVAIATVAVISKRNAK